MLIRSFSFLFILLLTVLCSVVTHATPADQVSALQDKAVELQLWHSREWINLLHYYPDRMVESGYLSQVDDERFFNAVDGVNDPQAEMLATLAAFYRIDVMGNNHPLCRFPARLRWLSEHITINKKTLPNVVCSDYDEWRKVVQARQVTLIFPTYHLNSPSSMFGHTLLRLDRSADENESKWLSFAVNFGANIRATDNSLLYAVKGLTGGYPGIFIVTPYYNKIREYNRIEKRDIWEYQLNLTPVEVNRIVVHLWELKEINFDYYFFDENCSYRLLELLEVARPGLELTNDFDLTAIPIDTIKAIEAADLIKNARFRPSQATELKLLLAQFSISELDLFEQLVNDIDTVKTSKFVELLSEKQQKIIDAAYRYQRHQQVSKVRDNALAKRSHALLALLNQYSADDTPLPIIVPIQPEKGHHSRRISIGIGERNDQVYQEVSMKLGFHSLEDNNDGFLRGAHINMANLQLHISSETQKLKLQRLDVIDIFSLTPRSRFFKPMSWRVYAGLERQMTDGVDRLASHVTAGAGVSYKLFDAALFYALGTGRIEFNRGFSDKYLIPAAGLGVASGILWHFSSMTTRLELAGEKFSNGNFRSRLLLRHNISLARNHALHLSVNGENYNSSADRFFDITLSYRYYF
ncbi:putative outermembrane protein [hydrothermal vent metagenome]|uniref:Putative outermembrane protein n=1 Tax=hydrothermal vent metagenome TaxID=652676 RepID=A0A3B0ZMZ0_9ZZZZ